ncbi:hypothetical protein KAI92_03450, partial [Candidatus Parcubacteria bacterium]|nr:hypothetical protein [Candidatus Parcubacteria bacterium]
NNVNLTWNAVDLAESYRIYRNGNMISTTNNLYSIDNGIVPGESYVYKVIAVRGNRTSLINDGVSIDIPVDELPVPTIESIIME